MMMLSNYWSGMPSSIPDDNHFDECESDRCPKCNCTVIGSTSRLVVIGSINRRRKTTRLERRSECFGCGYTDLPAAFDWVELPCICPDLMQYQEDYS